MWYGSLGSLLTLNVSDMKMGQNLYTLPLSSALHWEGHGRCGQNGGLTTFFRFHCPRAQACGKAPFHQWGQKCVGQPPSLTLSSLLPSPPLFSHLLSFPSLLLPSLPTLLDRKGMDSPWRVWEISESNFQASEVSRVGYHPHPCEPLQCQACRNERAKEVPSSPSSPAQCSGLLGLHMVCPNRSHLPCPSAVYKCF